MIDIGDENISKREERDERVKSFFLFFYFFNAVEFRKKYYLLT